MLKPAGPVMAISLLAGAADSLTGICLMVAPEMTLALMGVEVDPVSLVFIRYIGAFVLAVGGSYFPGLMPVWRRADWTLLRTVWMMTAWIRLVVCLFTTAAIFSGALEIAWSSVPLTDGFLALLQGTWLVLGPWPGREGDSLS